MASTRWNLAVLLLPPLVTLTMLFVLPILFTAAYSFWSVDNDYQLVQQFTLNQYEAVLSEPLYRNTLLNSVVMAAATTVVCVVIGVPLAWAMARNFSPRMRILLIVGLILPGWVSVLIRTYSMNLVIGESGLLNWLLLASGMIETPLRILFTKGAVVLGLVYIYLPYTLIPIFAAIERLDPAVLEAAENLGAGPVRRFRRIVLPLIMPGIVAGALLVFTISIDDYLITSFVAGVGATTLPLQIYSMLKVAVTPEVNAVSTLLILLTVALIVAAQRLQQGPSDRGGKP
jgi:ABC-type spermidine/putrescine transport system permease subunit I